MKTLLQIASTIILVTSLIAPINAYAQDTAAAALDKGQYALVTIFTIKQDKEAKLSAAMSKNVVGSRTELGGIFYCSHHKNGNNQAFINLENFYNTAAFDAP